MSPSGLPQWLSDKKISACRCRKHGFDPWVRKIPWSRQCNLLPYSCLGNSWWATVHGVAKSRTRLSSSNNKKGVTSSRRLRLGLPSLLPPPGAAPLDGAWEAGGPWGFPRLEQAAPLFCSRGGPDGNHGHLFLPGCGGNRSSDLPGAHMGQDTSLPGRDQIPGSQEKESILIYIRKLMKTLLGVPAL